MTSYYSDKGQMIVLMSSTMSLTPSVNVQAKKSMLQNLGFCSTILVTRISEILPAQNLIWEQCTLMKNILEFLYIITGEKSNSSNPFFTISRKKMTIWKEKHLTKAGRAILI